MTDPLQGLPLGEVPIAVHADARGRILVVDQAALGATDDGFGILYEVDPASGNRTVVTDFASAADQESGALFFVDAVTGNRTFLSDFGIAAQGPTGVESCGIAIFPSGVGIPGVDVRDLALTKIVVPAAVKLTAAKPSVTKNVKVQIQNRGMQPVAVFDTATLQALVELDVASLGACPAPMPALVVPSKFSIAIKSKQRLTLGYRLTFDCANDSAKTTSTDPGHYDFDFSARVRSQRLVGLGHRLVPVGCTRLAEHAASS